MKNHYYKTDLTWTGNKGEGTKNYRSYDRSYTLSIEGKPDLLGSSDPSFRGDNSKYNPEEMLVASLSSCHLLWYLHLCSVENILVLEYSDNAEGIMKEKDNGAGYFEMVTLKPTVKIKNSNNIPLAIALHKKANEMCFIANSVNFPVKHEPTILIND